MAAHVVMTYATKFSAKDFVFSGFSRRKPKVRHHPWHHIHLAANLRYIEIVQDIFSAQQDFHRPVERKANFIIHYKHIVLPCRILGIKAEGIGGINKPDIRFAQLCVLAGKTKGPLPLLGDHFKFVGIFRHPDEIVVDNQAWRQHSGNTYRSNDNQP
ncbi:hypothetical protein D3C86_1470270 [compost metagenome]